MNCQFTGLSFPPQFSDAAIEEAIDGIAGLSLYPAVSGRSAALKVNVKPSGVCRAPFTKTLRLLLNH